jgi:peptide subunit release factor 1 (eRF1)
MEQVEYNELDYWRGECPKCQGWNETQDDPGYQDSVICDDCGSEYEPVPG